MSLLSKAVIYKKPDASTAAAARSVAIEIIDVVPLESVPCSLLANHSQGDPVLPPAGYRKSAEEVVVNCEETRIEPSCVKVGDEVV